MDDEEEWAGLIQPLLPHEAFSLDERTTTTTTTTAAPAVAAAAAANATGGKMSKDSKLSTDSKRLDEFPIPKRFTTQPQLDYFNLKVVYTPNHTGFEKSKEFPIRAGTLIAGRYRITHYLGAAAFSKAVQCIDLQTQQQVCVKIIKNDKDYVDQSLDEIKILNLINHHDLEDKMNCVRMLDCFYFKEHLFLVCELLKENLYDFSQLLKEPANKYAHLAVPYFTVSALQTITQQLLVALNYVNTLRLIHCDLKPENILLRDPSSYSVKLIDFGSSCFIHDHLTSYVQSRSYRAPEAIFGLPYGYSIDMWSLGCVLYELYTGNVLFANESVPCILARMIGILGMFDEEMMHGKYVSRYFLRQPCDPDEEAGETGTVYRYVVHERDEEGRVSFLQPKRTSLRHRMTRAASEDPIAGADPKLYRLFLEFLAGLLQTNPRFRLTPSQALQHPFLKYHSSFSTTSAPTQPVASPLPPPATPQSSRR